MVKAALKYQVLLKKVCELYVAGQASEAERLIGEQILRSDEKANLPQSRERMEFIASNLRLNTDILPLIEVYEAFMALDAYYRADGMKECFQLTSSLYEEAYCAMEKMTRVKKYMSAEQVSALECDFNHLKNTLRTELPPRLRNVKSQGRRTIEIGHSPLEKNFKSSVRAFRYKKMSDAEKKDAFQKIRNMAYVMYKVMSQKLEDPALWYGEKVLCMEQMISVVNWLDWKRSEKFKRKQEIYHDLALLHKKHKCFAEAGRAEIMEQKFASSIDNMVSYTVKKKGRQEKYFER